MKKNYVLTFLLCLLVAGITYSCKEDEKSVIPTELSIDPANLDFKSSDVEKGVKVTSTVGWEALLKNAEDEAWCKLRTTSDSLFVSVTPNTDTEKGRTADVVVRATNANDSKEVTLKVTQGKAEPATLALDPEKVYIECEGQVPSLVKVYTNVQPLNVKWVEEEGVEHDFMNEPVIKNDTIVLTAQDNPTKLERSTKLVVFAGSEGNQAVDTLTITQSGNKPYIRLNPDTIRLDYKGTPQTLEIYYNTPELDESTLLKPDYFFTVEEVPQEATRAEEMKAKKKVYKVQAPMNGNLEPRSQFTSVYGTLNGGTPDEDFIYKDLIVEQAGAPKPEISVDQLSVVFPKDGGSKTVAVTSPYEEYELFPSESWLKAEQEGTNVKITAEATTSAEPRTGTVLVKVGTAQNSASVTISVTQAGTKSSITLSTNELKLSADGTQQVVNVVTDAEDWWVEGAPEWLTYKEDKEKGTLTISATPAEQTREAELTIIATSGSDKYTASLKVTQTKNYKVGELYVVDGKPVGIVFHVTDNGQHGYVMSLKDNQLGANNGGDIDNPIAMWSIKMYASDSKASEELMNSQPVALDKNDGRVNMAAIKNRKDAIMNGRTWQECYPAMAWVEKFDRENGNLGWYIPSMNEMIMMTCFLNGLDGVPADLDIYGGPFLDTPEAEKKREEIDRLLTENGGDQIWWNGGGSHPNCQYFYSSTELAKVETRHGYVGIFVAKFKTMWFRQDWAGEGYYQGRVDTATACSVRPMLRF